MADFTIKQGDLRPPLLAQLLEPDAENGGTKPSDITDATVTIVFKNQKPDSEAVVGNCTILDGPTGKISYSWAIGDTDTPGVYDFEFRVVFPDESLLSYPTDGYRTLEIVRSL